MNTLNRWLITLILLLCAMPRPVHADPASLAWWFLPEDSGDLPHEIEDDPMGNWSEIWLRPGYDADVEPRTVMEQGLGVRWIGMEPNKDGIPTKAVLILGGRRIVDFDGENARAGTIDDQKITWADGKTQSLYEFRRRHHRRRRRRRRTSKIRFGKIDLPPLASRERPLKTWSVQGLDAFLTKMTQEPGAALTTDDLSAVAQISDQNGSLLNFKYADDCDLEDRAKIESVLARDVEPKLTCWMEQNTELGSRLLGALMQKPIIECRAREPMDNEDCGMATMPYVSAFFLSTPRINIPVSRCEGELGQTLLHEIFHLAGMPEDEARLDEAVSESESCRSFPASLDFDNESEGFVNDFQVQTRIFLFRKIRDEAVSQWGWTSGEASFFLGAICKKMGDKYCSRNFFQKAAAEKMQGMVQLPEGTEVTWASLAQYEYFDSITEDINRMHELVRYLLRDPNGTLLRRIETGVYRLHEFFVARSALEEVKNNKGVCGGFDSEEPIMCEDLAQIVKTPWFRNP